MFHRNLLEYKYRIFVDFDIPQFVNLKKSYSQIISGFFLWKDQ
ncbi:hypothetical protein FCR2A7T_22880 [Flavobacterium cauense R2A-7]|nr:hypothetical protein FCR2A7T_22880 [Flavobacterium cauense R2A-7]